jgi:hypothetical protein
MPTPMDVPDIKKGKDNIGQKGRDCGQTNQFANQAGKTMDS